MDYPKILTVQDISCVGQCSLTVALPILSACGAECCILPSAVLSTHTAGFTGFTFRDLTEDIPGIAAHWLKEGICFDAIYTGYLGSAKQIGYVRDLMAKTAKTGCVKIVDPAMADNGKLYPAFDLSYVEEMKPLCFESDILLPNITEACFLTGIPYRENYDRAYIDSLIDALHQGGAKTVVLTGVGYESGKTGVVTAKKGCRPVYYEHEKISRGCHGTGDVYASAFVGALMRGKDEETSARIAADYTVECIRRTVTDPDHWYGVKFETALADLYEMIK